MNTMDITNIDSLDNLGTIDFTEVLLHSVYPGMFMLLKEAGQNISEMEIYGDVALLSSIHQRMTDELDEMCRKEKLVLFPYLVKLESQKNCVGCATAFKNIKQHYNCILSLLQETRQIFKNLSPTIGEKQSLKDIKDAFAEFEVILIKMYYKKELFLFTKFKNDSRVN